MNRQIIFRGKRVDGKGWVEGGLVRGKESTFIVFDGQFNDDYFISPRNVFIEVDPATVGQFTGLTDKNGQKIWEGDIIGTKFFPQYVERIQWQGPPDAVCEVYWDFSGYGLKAKGEKDSRYPGLHEMNFKETEVIGNIYENIDLLPCDSEGNEVEIVKDIPTGSAVTEASVKEK